MKTYLLSIFKMERSVLLFIFSWSMIGLIHGGILPVLTNLYVLKIGFDISFIGIMNGSSSIVFALSSFPVGLFGSRFGLRTGVISAYLVVVLGLAVFLGARWLPQSFWSAGLLIGNGLVGLAAALVMVNGIPYLMAIAPEQDRNKAFTLMSALFALMAFLGSLAAGTLPDVFIHLFPDRVDEAMAFNIVMWLAIPVYLLSAWLMHSAQAEPKTVREMRQQVREVLPVTTLLFLGLFFALQMSSENAVNMFVNVYFAENLQQPATLIGIVFAVARLLPFLVSPIQPLVLNRWGAGRVLAGGYLLVAACSLLIALFPSVLASVILFVLFSVITSFTGTARNLFGQETVQAQWRTASSAMQSISQAAAGGLVGFAAGSILNAAGFRGMFLSSAVMAIIAVLLFVMRRSKVPQTELKETVA